VGTLQVGKELCEQLMAAVPKDLNAQLGLRLVAADAELHTFILRRLDSVDLFE
jgi:hypothetical protein